MSALKLIYDKLHSGECFGKIEKHRQGGTYFWDVLYIGQGTGKEYIFWRHYGSSANSVSLQNLKWILTKIFEMAPEEFLFNYTTYNEWKKIDKCYVGDKSVY